MFIPDVEFATRLTNAIRSSAGPAERRGSAPSEDSSSVSAPNRLGNDGPRLVGQSDEERWSIRRQPRPIESSSLASVSGYEAGPVAVNAFTGYEPSALVLHAARKTLAGPVALCGAGRISGVVGRFRGDLRNGCSACAVAMRHQLQTGARTTAR
jgi:hypothetical protein